MQIAIAAFHVDTGSYPTSLQALITPQASATNWLGPYLKAEVPLDPWGNAYVYQFPGTHTNKGVAFDLYSRGADNGEGIIANWELATHPQTKTP